MHHAAWVATETVQGGIGPTNVITEKQQYFGKEGGMLKDLPQIVMSVCLFDTMLTPISQDFGCIRSSQGTGKPLCASLYEQVP